MARTRSYGSIRTLVQFITIMMMMMMMMMMIIVIIILFFLLSSRKYCEEVKGKSLVYVDFSMLLLSRRSPVKVSVRILSEHL